MAIGIAALLVAGCGGTKVTRIDPETTVDLSGRWNDTDSRTVAEAITQDCLHHPWVTEHLQRQGGKVPIVIAGAVRNLGTEHIAVGTFLADIERALINSGRAQVVARPDERGDLRLERADQWANASEETVKRLGQELGADYMMTGAIHTITDQVEGKRVIFYQVDMTLMDIESNLKVWVGQHKIKKFVARGQFKP
ncbi:MAG: penicillin-binding protein activator LpoB [Candidatus Eisenbacteria bacterium]|uniref:Penicillin-binding protein activator LpoB n=1 Tax=Eiseniibacteriota bacterium TaxID=2212470 RepID=A0A938BL63_UNCEI|nr:penicillin-binding protein activator LpoB [Candidatus Eisenbacteria bacterium]